MEVRYQLRYSPARPLIQMSLTPRGQTLEDRTTNVKRSYPATAATLTIPPSTSSFAQRMPLSQRQSARPPQDNRDDATSWRLRRMASGDW